MPALQPAGRVAVHAGKRQVVWSSSSKPPGRVCKARSAPATTAYAEADTIEVDLKVEGMVCEHCSARVQDTLSGMAIVDTAAVSHETGIATVQVNATDMFDAFNQLPILLEAVNSLGFQAQPYFDQEE